MNSRMTKQPDRCCLNLHHHSEHQVHQKQHYHPDNNPLSSFHRLFPFNFALMMLYTQNTIPASKSSANPVSITPPLALSRRRRTTVAVCAPSACHTPSPAHHTTR